jgi:hypothetical protein
MTSVLNVDTIADKAGTGPVALTKQYAAKMWVRYDGSGVMSITDSAGLSSLSDDGTGLATLTVTNAMSNANYAVSGVCQFQNNTGQTLCEGPSDATTTAYEFRTKTTGNTLYDSDQVSSLIHGDLA